MALEEIALVPYQKDNSSEDPDKKKSEMENGEFEMENDEQRIARLQKLLHLNPPLWAREVLGGAVGGLRVIGAAGGSKKKTSGGLLGWREVQREARRVLRRLRILRPAVLQGAAVVLLGRLAREKTPFRS